MTNAVQANKHDNDSLDMHSPNLVDDNVQKIIALFPNCITESEDENGKLKKSVDFDLLRQELSQSLVEGGQERYRLDWPGKRQAILEANSPIAKTLRPARGESVNFDTTENLFIEGDNLDALKLLQESYLGQVKMIYIDPPYNTGNDFIYEDDFAENTEDFLERSEQKDKEGNRLVSNTETNGRFHSDWLTMMYSRLKLARSLLSDNGIIFISCDDNEHHNLRKICDEVFGADNFVANFIWEKRTNRENRKKVSYRHDNVLVFCKNRDCLDIFQLPMSQKALSNYKNPDNDSRGLWKSDPATAQGGHGTTSQFYDLVAPNGKTHELPSGRCWLYTEKVMKKHIDDNRIWFGKDGNGVPRIKTYLNAKERGLTPETILFADRVKTNEAAKNELKDIFSGKSIFETPKPFQLIHELLLISTKSDDIILDFFAGSSTTAHSVMQLNAEDSENRKFIMVQLDEPIDSNTQKDAYKFCQENNFETNIAEISKERIRSVGQKILADNQDKDSIEDLDIGFRVLKIDSTNMKEVYYTPDEYSQADLDNLESHIKEDRTGEDLLFQVMLDWGVPLSLPIEVKDIQGSSVYYVGIDSLVACFDTLTTDLVDEVAKEKPLKFVSSELAIAHDQDKTNIKARFAQLSPDTQVKFI